MHEELDSLDLAELVEQLDDLEGRRTPVGWTPDDAVMKAALERRILELVAAQPDEGRRRGGRQLACDLEVSLRTQKDMWPARLASLCVGGALLETNAEVPLGTHVHVQIRAGVSELHGLHVRGKVSWREEAPIRGLGVSFTDQPSPAHERRLQRFVKEALRHRVNA